MDIWKPIKGYEGLYEVSEHGEVRSLERYVPTGIRHSDFRKVKGRILKKALKSNGYYTVDLSKENKVKTISVHRLVALAFLPNPNNFRVVNHKNGIKTDNRVSNLEWTTDIRNHHHAAENNLRENVGQYQNKKIKCIDTDIVFKNSVKAAEWILENEPHKTKCNEPKKLARNIRRCSTGGTPKAYGYRWTDIT